MSLNNRISIRDASGARSGVMRSPPGSSPSSTTRSEGTEIMLMDVKAPTSFKVHEIGVESEAQERVISEPPCLLPPFPQGLSVLGIVDIA